MIPLTSLRLSHLYTEMKQSLYVLSVSASWGVDEVLIAKDATLQHSGLNNFFLT